MHRSVSNLSLSCPFSRLFNVLPKQLDQSQNWWQFQNSSPTEFPYTKPLPSKTTVTWSAHAVLVLWGLKKKKVRAGENSKREDSNEPCCKSWYVLNLIKTPKHRITAKGKGTSTKVSSGLNNEMKGCSSSTWKSGHTSDSRHLDHSHSLHTAKNPTGASSGPQREHHTSLFLWKTLKWFSIVKQHIALLIWSRLQNLLASNYGSRK